MKHSGFINWEVKIKCIRAFQSHNMGQLNTTALDRLQSEIGTRVAGLTDAQRKYTAKESRNQHEHSDVCIVSPVRYTVSIHSVPSRKHAYIIPTFI